MPSNLFISVYIKQKTHREIIRDACKIEGIGLSGFFRLAALERARRIIKDSKDEAQPIRKEVI